MLNGKKTYIIGILSIFSAGILLANGSIDTGAFTQILVTALASMGIRHGISTSK